MFNRIILFAFILSTIVQCKKPLNRLPITPAEVVYDEYHGVRLGDPYRYMENLSDSTFNLWLKDQNTFSEDILNTISFRDTLKKQIKKLEQEKAYIISNVNQTENGTYFYIKKKTNEIEYKLYMRKGFEDTEQFLYSTEDYKSDELDNYIINYINPSRDASKVAISLSKNDEEFSEMIFYDVFNKKILPDCIDHIWPNALGGINWLSDNSSFLYTSVPIIDKNRKEYLLNSQLILYSLDKQTNPITVLSRDTNPEFNFKEEEHALAYDRDTKYIFAYKSAGTYYNDNYFTTVDDIYSGKPNWNLLYKKEEKILDYYVKNDDLIYITSKGAPNNKICQTSLLNPDFDTPKILVPEDPEREIYWKSALTKSSLYYVKTFNGVEAKLYRLQNGIEKEIEIPIASGNINPTSISPYSDDLWVEIDGWLNKTERYYYDISEGEFIPENFNPIIESNPLKDVIVEEVEVNSHDNVKVPLSIIYKKGTKKNRMNQVLIVGYGAYGSLIKPYPYKYLIHWVNQGGVFALAHVRGGGEKGDNWHKGGYKTTKSNTWKDFIACSEYLINQKYTSKKRIAALGISAGGICVGRAITERPDLFSVAIAHVGVFNMIRSEFAPFGKNNMHEFGTVKDSIEFKALLEMDSYHHVKDGVKYPAVFLTAGMNDARVPAWQPAKFAARLQAANASDKPILLSVDFEGGHGIEADKDKKNQETANILAFALWQTGHPDYQPK